MTIGELLKQKRLEKDKTQKEWVGDIISPSYYAKVEKNKHRIAADDLFAILNYNDLSISDFFKKLEKEQNNFKEQEEALNHLVIQAVYNNDINKLKDIIQLIEESDWPKDRKEEDILEVRGMIEDVKIDLDQTYQPDQKVVNDLKDKIFSIPNFTQFKLELFGNFMMFYDWKTNIMITKQITKQIDKKTKAKELLAISAILSNLISQLIEAGQYEQTLPLLKVAEKIPNLPDLYLTRTGLALHKYLINYHFTKKQEDLDKAELIVKTYLITGLKEFGQSAQRFINQEIKRQKDHS